MANPVPVPGGPLSIDDTDIALAEAFVAAIAQIMQSGTTGGAGTGASASIYPITVDGVPVAVSVGTKEQQLFYRQLGIAIAKSMALGATLNVNSGGPITFPATCDSAAVVGDLVYVSAASMVRGVDYTDPSKMPAVGCIVSKQSTTTCTVQTAGVLSGVYSGLAPGSMYYTGPGQRPVLLPAPSVGQTLYLQALGVALDASTLVISPSMTLTRVRG